MSTKIKLWQVCVEPATIQSEELVLYEDYDKAFEVAKASILKMGYQGKTNRIENSLRENKSFLFQDDDFYWRFVSILEITLEKVEQPVMVN